MTRSLAVAALAGWLAACVGACGGASVAAQRPLIAQPGPVLHFAYEAVDGRPVSTEALAGRFAVLGFLTTYDFPSQVEARHLANLEKHHSPRVNVAALVLEKRENWPLVQAYAKTVGLPYPLAIPDEATVEGAGPFAGLHHVPSVVILDRQGREVWRHIGLVDEATLEAALHAAEAAP